MVSYAVELHDRFGAVLSDDEPLDRHTTMGVGGKARHFVMPRSATEAADALQLLAWQGIPWFVLGGGSNLLIKESGFDGAVVNLSALRAVERRGTRLRVGAGTPTALVCKLAMRAGLTGVVGLVGIPGTIGGAVFMNAGGRHGEIGDVVESVKAADEKGRIFRLTREQVGFEYRRTRLHGMLVLETTLALEKGEKARICERMARILKKKHQTQPMGHRSAGCVFKNPEPSRAAAMLIDRAGLKGMRAGGAEVSTRHANFIVNTRTARSEDVFKLIAKVRREILLRHGTPLQLEVQVLGARGLEVG